jgi:alpha-L-rhamnosidase
VQWEGDPIPRDTKVWWSVQIRDSQGRESEFAEPAWILTGLSEEEWQADWIARYFVLPAGREIPSDTHYDNRFQARPADYLRRSFKADRPVKAFVYVTALGLYELYLNGRRVGSDVMAPGWTDYHKRVEYQAHDVTDFICDGDNVLGAILGEGWYCGRVGHNQRRAGNHYGGRPALMCQLHLHHSDGRIQRIISNEAWQTRQGPICYSDFLMGEMYDARLEMHGWNEPGKSGDNWQPVEVFRPEPRPPLRNAARANPVREVAGFSAITEHVSPDGERIFDMSQNISGYVRLEVAAPAGTRIVLRHAERLTPEGTLYTDNLRFAVSEDIYICKGGGVETFKPRFTFHGFQYVGLKADAPIEHLSLEAVAIGTDLPVTGQIKTGHPMLNKLISNIFWSQRDNFLAVPTDCPQRDERYGWTADAQVFWRTAGYFMDIAAFTEKWMVDLIDGQSIEGAFPDVAPTKPLNPYRLTPQPGAPAWGDAPVILAWDHWCRYADKLLVRQSWPALLAWANLIEQENPQGIRVNFVNNNYGDWLSVGPPSDRSLINTAYWIRVVDLMGHLARVIDEDTVRWTRLAARLRKRFTETFVETDGRLTGDTQTAYLLALDFKLLPPELRMLAISHLKRLLKAANGHLQTGFLGVRHLVPVVSDTIGPQAAMDLLLRESYPSWGCSIRHGATTIWERWDGWTPENGFQSPAMNSFNHYAYGAIGEWIWARLAGIDWSENTAGYQKVLMRPIFDQRVGYVTAKYQSTTGEIASAWHFETDGSVQWTVALAPGISAEVTLQEGWTADGRSAFEIAAGTHRFKIMPSAMAAQ